MKIRSLDMSDFNLGSRVYWWAMVVAGSAITLVSLVGLRSLSPNQWVELLLLAGLVVLASRHPLDIPNVKASVSISDVFIFLGLFYLGTGPAVLLGSIDNFISARQTAKRATSWILAPNIMAVTVLFSAAAFNWTLKISLARPPAWPIRDDEISFLAFFPALVALGLVQYLTNGWLVAWFYARRANKPVYLYWRDGYLWTSWAFFASAITAGTAYCLIERYGLFHMAAALPVIVASYLTYKIYFERVTEKTRHIELMNRLHLSTVEALASAIDAKDQTTHGHVRRVQIYAEGIAKLFNLSDAEIEALKAGALLHDIGKLAVPDYILNKPGKLTPAEFEKMKIHTVVGAQILGRVGFPYPVVPIVRHHHERWDGTGYPDGLAGEQIPITARIMSVVDCFDALHEDRQYRRALTREQAVEFVRKAAGTQFDPQVVKLFLENLPKFEAQVTEYQVEEVENNLSPDEAAFPATELRASQPEVSQSRATDYRDQISRAHQEVYALYEIARTFGSSLNIEDAMAIIANKLGYMVRFDTCVIYRYHEASGLAVAEHVTGAYADYLRGRCAVPGEGITGYVLANAKPLTNTDPMLDFGDLQLPPEASYSAVAVFPLKKDDRLLGALALYSMTLAQYTNDDLRLLETVARIASDALDNAVLYAETRYDAMTDVLTGLPNSRALQLRFEQEAARADRSGSPFHVLMLDLDHFKPVNDTHGHQVGDEVLKAVGQLLNSQFREYDFFARYAGDEFVALVTQMTDQQCDQLCLRLQEVVSEFRYPVRDGQSVKVGISVGSALYSRDGRTMDKLLLKADRSMYSDKKIRKSQTGSLIEEAVPA